MSEHASDHRRLYTAESPGRVEGVSGRLLVPFEGDGAGVAELSWGQRNIWMPVRRHHTSLPLGGVLPLETGVSVDDVVGVLRFLMGRHQSLRTRVEFDPAAERQARQVLSSGGEIPVEIVDSTLSGQDPLQAAQAISRRFQETEFDYPNEWPLRCAIVTRANTPTHLVMTICHLSIDGPGIRALLADLLWQGADRIGLTANTVLPGAALSRSGHGGLGTPPFEQAHWQASTEGRRTDRRALQHWERLMNRVPARRFVAVADPREPQYWTATSQSDAAYLAVHAVAARLGVRTAPVLFAAYAVAFARTIGGTPVLAQLILSNRLRPGLAESVSPVAQPGLALVDVADATFDQVVHSAWRATVTASRHSYYDPYAQLDLIDAVGARRGEPMEIRCLFNDRRIRVGPEPIGPSPTPEQLAEARARTTIGWAEPSDRSTEPFFASVENVPGTIAWSVDFDTHNVSPASVEAFLREMEAALVSAASDPTSARP